MPEAEKIAKRSEGYCGAGHSLAWEHRLVCALLLIELQTRAEADMRERVAEYAIRLWRRRHLPVMSVISYLTPLPCVVAPPFVIEFLGWGNTPVRLSAGASLGVTVRAVGSTTVTVEDVRMRLRLQ
jgi:hypothetical protein